MCCSTCGASIDCNGRFCSGCGTSVPVENTGELQTVKSGPEFASLGRRVLATIVDLTACWCLISLLVMIIPAQWIEDGFAGRGFAVVIPIGLCSIALIYYIVFEALYGATLGKAITGIQVRRRDGDACGFQAALIRNMLRPIDAFAGYLVGLVVALISTSRQRFGDAAAGTIVVNRTTPSVVQLSLVVAWLVLGSGTFIACQVVRH